jgi:YbbR domain-containing protein
LLHNWPAKMLSIAIALMLFVFHRMSTLATRTISVPLLVETASALVPASAYPQNVRITMRGEDDSIRVISDSDIEAFVDLRRHEAEGFYRAPIQIRKGGTALGVEPLELSINPMEISVRLDIRASKTLPVLADIRGKVASGFDLIDYSVSPEEIIVSGPVGVLEDMIEMRTVPVDLDGRRNDFNIEVNISRDNPFLVFRGSGMVEFQGIVRPSVPVRNIEGIPIVFARLDPRFEAHSSERIASVRLEGNYSLLDDFIPGPGFLSVDCSELLEPGTYVLPVRADLPFGLFLVRSEPENLSIVVTRRAVIAEEAPGETE